MNKKLLFALWAALFILCAGLGFIPEPAGLLRAGLTGLSLLFFLPPALLLWQFRQERSMLRLIRNLSVLSLVLTAVLLVLNIFSALWSPALGTVLHYVLITVSSPMFCSGYWVLSLFLWACLLFGSLSLLKQTNRS